MIEVRRRRGDITLIDRERAIHLLTQPVKMDEDGLRSALAVTLARCPRCKSDASEPCVIQWGPQTHTSRIRAAAKIAERGAGS